MLRQPERRKRSFVPVLSRSRGVPTVVHEAAQVGRLDAIKIIVLAKNIANDRLLFMIRNSMKPALSIDPAVTGIRAGGLADVDPLSRLIDEAQAVRTSIGFKRSDKLLRVFDFLVARTCEGRPPTEIDIANEVFSIGRDLDAPQDATVRVCVHRLRKALDRIYEGKPGPRLLIPKGEYRVILADEDLSPCDDQSEETAPIETRRGPPWTMLGLGLLLLGVVNFAIWWSVQPRRQPDGMAALASTYLWRPVTRSNRPITVVLGDYYLFGEAQDAAGGKAPLRLIRNPSINAREDLDVYLMTHPGEIGRAVDMDLRYTPSGAVLALGTTFAAMRGLKPGQAVRPNLIPASQLTPDILKTSDVVYIGQLSGLGILLRNPLFQASGFKIGRTYDELVDGVSGRRFQSDGGIVQADEQIARRDYGYIASLPGPSGNRIIIIAGTRDPALLQMAELAVDPGRLKVLDRRAALNPSGFEALYQVRTMGSLNLSGVLLMERPLRLGGVWDKPNASQRFPDDMYEGAGHPKN